MTVSPLALQGATVAHCAAEAPDAATLRLLMERGISLDIRDHRGNSPIHWAATKGQLACLKLLVEEAGVNPRQRNNKGLSPLDTAASNGRVKIVRYLVEERGIDPTDANSKVGLKLPLLKRLVGLIIAPFPQGGNPLHHACWNFHAHVAEYLLDNTRIHPLAKDKQEGRALLIALRPCDDGEAPDHGLPILELFHRKAPQALNSPGAGPGGKERGGCLGLWILGIGSADADNHCRLPADPRCCLARSCPVPPAAAGAGGRPGP